MAWENVNFGITLEAAADLSALQHRFLVVDSNGRFAQNTSSGGTVDAVLQNKPSALGRAANGATVGVSKVEAGAAVAAGALVMSDTVGRGITWTTTNHAAGRALTAASGAGEVIEVLLGTYGVD